MIETNFSSRQDLAFLYYPSAIEFYWFVARTYSEIRRKEKHGPLPYPALKKVGSVLDRPLHVTMTSAVIRPAHIDDDGNIYFEDFLGNGDNSTKVLGEDRLFTTATAINASLGQYLMRKLKNSVGKKTFPIYPSTRDGNGAFEGTVSEKEYQKLLKQNWSGQQAPLYFHGYNSYPEYWPFWCSEPYTFATTMLALSKFSNTFDV